MPWEIGRNKEFKGITSTTSYVQGRRHWYGWFGFNRTTFPEINPFMYNFPAKPGHFTTPNQAASALMLYYRILLIE